MNQCSFTGRLKADPEFKNVNGKSLVSLTLAVQETKDKVYWFNFTAWEKTADLINQYCKKGNKILVECKAVQETWESPDGKKNSKTKFLIHKVEFLESKNSSGNTTNEQESNVNESNDPEDVF